VLGIYTAYGLFDNVYPAGAPNTQWASASTYSSGNYTGSVSTTVQGGIGTVLGEWFQLQVSAPLILQSYRYATQDIQNTPKIYYIVGSNDGSTWFPIHYMSMIANPFTGSSKTLASNIIINHTGVQSIIVDVAGAGSTTSYPTSTTPYLYFRVIITTLLSIGTNAVYSEFLPNFAKPSPSQLALNYSGQYQMVATGPAAGCVMPNQTGLTTATWVQGGVQWGSSESSQTGSNPGYLAFNNTSTTGSGWATLSTKYNLTTGVYIASISTTILGGVGAQAGEWLQIQSSVPMVLQSYTFSVAESFPRFPKVFYIVGSMDGSNWYPLQYASLASNPFTVTNSTASTYLSINTTGSQTLTAGASATVTTTSYSTSTSPYMYFRIIVQNIFASNDGLVQIGEWYLNFQNSLSYSSNYGATWSNQSNVITNEIAAISPSGQYALSTNCVPPLARLTMDGTNVDSQGVLVPATGAGTVTYSSSIVKVGSHSAYFNNTAGSSPSVYLNYTVPAVLNTPSALTMACWVYPTALPASNTSIPIAFNNSANTTTAAQQIIIQTSGVVLFNYVTSVTSGNITLPAITLNSWTHYTMTYSGGTCSVFVNGVFNTSVTPGGNLALTTANANMERLIIGANLSNINAFAGYVDDVRLYTSALSAHEVAALYSNPALTQAVGVSSSYLPITSYSKPALPGATANVVDAKVSQTGQYMVAVTAANTNNVYYSTDSGSTFNALTVNGYTQAGATTPLARLPFDNSNGDVLGALTPATGAGSITYSTSIKKVGTHSVF
jgi:hypothetical protein